MNAIAQPSHGAHVYLSEDYFAMKRHMDDAIALYGNGYEDNRDSAIAAISLGRAAYWTTSSYGAARTVDLPLALHRGLSIKDALEEAFPSWRAGQRPAALDTLVPLNRKAAIALSNAYASFGIWIDEEALEMRRTRDCRKAGGVMKAAANTPTDMERALVEAKANEIYSSQLMRRFRETLANVRAGLEDEGDRIYFGSTNDADQLRDIIDEIEELEWDRAAVSKATGAE